MRSRRPRRPHGKHERDLFRSLRRQGATILSTGAGHVLVDHPERGKVFIASTPSDRRAHRNAEAMLRRAGYRL